ncbi:MAG TPA: hypothetical protein VEM36_15025 [Xanthobacteraceae bacterium]|nr:hypothetical protein [Xanthobacteraceae bacterium]
MKPIVLVVIAAALLAGCWGPGPALTGNDTGGIIPWSPDNERLAPAWARDHCARYNKYARATSIVREYGNYMGFECVWSPRVRP